MTKSSPTKTVDLSEVHRLCFIDVAGGLQHDEQRLPVTLQLRALVGLDRILHGRRVHPELFRGGIELLLRKFVEADPDDATPLPARLVGLPHRLRLGRRPST